MQLIYSKFGKNVYQDGDRLIKSFDNRYTKAMVLNEALNQARVEETDLHIPKIISVSNIGGEWSVSREFIAGETLDVLMEKNPEREREYLNLFVDLQIEMASKKVPLLVHLRDKLHAKISSSSYPSSLRYDLHVRLDGLPRQNKLCHGDFQPSNIILTPEGTPYIIDWSHATQGNESIDAARTYLVLYLQKKETLAENYLDLWCEKREIEKSYVLRILPIVAAAESVIAEKEERELLSKWVNVCDWQ